MKSATWIPDEIWKCLVSKCSHIKYCHTFCETVSSWGLFPPPTGCQVPALGNECPALHTAEDQVDGQVKAQQVALTHSSAFKIMRLFRFRAETQLCATALKLERGQKGSLGTNYHPIQNSANFSTCRWMVTEQLLCCQGPSAPDLTAAKWGLRLRSANLNNFK